MAKKLFLLALVLILLNKNCNANNEEFEDDDNEDLEKSINNNDDGKCTHYQILIFLNKFFAV